MANILEIKQENFKIDKNSLLLSGPPAKGASVVLFRSPVNTQNAAIISKKEFDIFKNTAMSWEQNQRRLGFFVVDLASAPKLVKSSMSTNTNLNVACSLCIFYYNGNPIMFLKKIPYDNPYEVRTLCMRGFEKIEAATQQQRQQPPPQGGGYAHHSEGGGNGGGGGGRPQKYSNMPEGLTVPNMTSLRHTKTSYQEENLLVPPDVIPYNAPWMADEN
jgi:hypothetical protein